MADIFEGVELTPEQQRELATLRAGYARLEGLITDPKTGTATKRLMRQKFTDLNIPIPEDDIAAPLVAAVEEKITATNTKAEEALAKIAAAEAGLLAKIAERDQQATDQRDLQKIENSIENAVKKYRFTDEGKAALIKHMMETNTPDPDTAGAYLVQHMEKPAPVASNGLAPAEARRNGAPDVDLFNLATGQTDESMKLLHGSPKQQEQWMTNEINKVIEEGITA
jgi:hypothetical protein